MKILTASLLKSLIIVSPRKSRFPHMKMLVSQDDKNSAACNNITRLISIKKFQITRRANQNIELTGTYLKSQPYTKVSQTEHIN